MIKPAFEDEMVIRPKVSRAYAANRKNPRAMPFIKSCKLTFRKRGLLYKQIQKNKDMAAKGNLKKLNVNGSIRQTVFFTMTYVVPQIKATNKRAALAKEEIFIVTIPMNFGLTSPGPFHIFPEKNLFFYLSGSGAVIILHG